MLKKITPIFVCLLIILAVWFSYYATQPHNVLSSKIPETRFSTKRAFKHVQAIGQKRHFVGTTAHSTVRNYIVNQLQDLGLEVQTQQGYSLTKRGVLTQPQNILAKIPGTDQGKALLVMAHYDSSAHSSFGASDDGSGVATILEGIRAFLAGNQAHKNDIILLFSDAEELGLNGAELFVKNHPWAKNVGLAINFEARGSGGNSFMLLETNGGNKALIQNFIKAHPKYPVTNSLAYSVYKMLPNDTDLTVLREQGNINGFNFAFIGDHFDYHTANDIPANLDKESLAQQGSYLMPLLNYFKDKDLSKLNSNQDLSYFNLPFSIMVSYPFAWIFPMLVVGFLLFFVISGIGLYKKSISVLGIFKGILPFFISLIGSALLVFLFWKLCLFVYPQFAEIEQGFPYNGYYYIAAAIFLTLSICFFVYSFFKRARKNAGYLAFPLLFWLVICALAAMYLKGASYFIIPAYFALLQFGVMIFQKRPNVFLMFFLSLPALFMLLPFISGFPVALGLKILFVAAILVVLLFSLFLPVFAYFQAKKALALLCFIAFNVLFIIAHFKSGFTSERPKPDSLVYVLNADAHTATWNSYDNIVDSYTRPYFGKNPKKAGTKNDDFSSKYGSAFTWTAKAPVIKILEPDIDYDKIKTGDSLVGNWYTLKIASNREINRIDLYVDQNRNFEEFEANGLKADSINLGNSNFHVFYKRWNKRLLTYYAANRDTLRLKFKIGGKAPVFTMYEASNNLLENKQLHVEPRNSKQIPRPFVLNDAIIVKKVIKFQ